MKLRAPLLGEAVLCLSRGKGQKQRWNEDLPLCSRILRTVEGCIASKTIREQDMVQPVSCPCQPSSCV